MENNEREFNPDTQEYDYDIQATITIEVSLQRVSDTFFLHKDDVEDFALGDINEIVEDIASKCEYEDTWESVRVLGVQKVRVEPHYWFVNYPYEFDVMDKED